jgi:hypothetical protein
MQFAPEKSKLIHFTQSRRPIKLKLRLGDMEIKPRFLSIWLDRKLDFNEHIRKVKGKLSTLNFALTRLAGSAWGCTLARAREIYTKVIRSAVAYGASVFHTPSTENRPKGVTRGLMAAQTRCLRTVAGAYKATPVRSLETETRVPPLDLYLNTRVARFERRP